MTKVLIYCRSRWSFPYIEMRPSGQQGNFLPRVAIAAATTAAPGQGDSHVTSHPPPPSPFFYYIFTLQFPRRKCGGISFTCGRRSEAGLVSERRRRRRAKAEWRRQVGSPRKPLVNFFPPSFARPPLCLSHREIQRLFSPSLPAFPRKEVLQKSLPFDLGRRAPLAWRSGFTRE